MHSWLSGINLGPKELIGEMNVYLVLLLPAYLLVEGSPSYNLSFMFITSFGEFGINSSGVVPAAEMAVRDINYRSALLPGYVLTYDAVRDSQCQYDRSLDVFFQGIQSAPVKLAIIGCGCSVATEPVAAISHHWNISQIAYFSGSPALSDRSRYRRFFRDIPSSALNIPAFVSLMKHFGWKRIFSITQGEALFTNFNSGLQAAMTKVNFTFRSVTFETLADPVQAFDGIFLTSDDYRIFFLNCYSAPARKIICEASKHGYTYPKYAWILYDWYIDNWWTAAVDGADVNCTDEELETFLEKALVIQNYLSPDSSTVLTDAGITPQQFQDEYNYLAQQGGYGITYGGGRLYDAVWILAVALNRTMIMVKSGNINGTGCENITGSLVPLEQFQYSNEKMGCLIQYNIQITNFSGVSGNIQFDSNGTCIQHTITLKQYNRYGNLTKVKFAYFNTLDNYTFMFVSGFSDQIVYPNGIPPDGTAVEITLSSAVPLVAIVYVLAVCGIIFAAVCFVFSIFFRKRRVVKLSSPNLNNIIILGAVSMYISVYIYILPITNSSGIGSSCVMREWLFVVGYALCFASVLAKMWRIYYIFQNPTAKKSIIKDWHMIAAALSITGVGVVLLILGSAVPQLRGYVMQERNQENPSGITNLGVKEQYYIWICYGSSTPSFYWRIVIYSYLGILQIIGIMLAFQTRNVKFPGLNDSLHVAAIIYTSSLVLVVLIVDAFVLDAYLNTFGAIFTLGIMVLTTVFLALTFVPKMHLLYKDPEGNAINLAAAPNTSIPVPNNYDASISLLEGTLSDKNEQIIMELRLENSMLKEKLISSSGKVLEPSDGAF